MRFNNKVAIVTGSAQGIGKVIAQSFASEGASVVLADIDIDKALHVARDIEGRGGVAVPSKTDISNISKSDVGSKTICGNTPNEFTMGLLITLNQEFCTHN